MAPLSIAFFALKIWYLVHATWQSNDLNGCFSSAIVKGSGRKLASIFASSSASGVGSDYGAGMVQDAAFLTTGAAAVAAATMIPLPIQIYLHLLKSMSTMTRDLSIASVVFVVFTTFYYHWKAGHARKVAMMVKKTGQEPMVRRVDRVTKPLIATMCGAFTIIFEAYTLGAVITTHRSDIVSRINIANGGECIAQSRLDTGFNLAWASLVIYAFLLVSGHWSGLETAYALEKMKQNGGSAGPMEIGGRYSDGEEENGDEEDEACC